MGGQTDRAVDRWTDSSLFSESIQSQHTSVPVLSTVCRKSPFKSSEDLKMKKPTVKKDLSEHSSSYLKRTFSTRWRSFQRSIIKMKTIKLHLWTKRFMTFTSEIYKCLSSDSSAASQTWWVQNNPESRFQVCDSDLSLRSFMSIDFSQFSLFKTNKL